jgi:hypothetical protein
MTNNYKVKVQVAIEEYTDATTDGPRQGGVGAFEWVISAQQARSIDECEQIVLRTNRGLVIIRQAALRNALRPTRKSRPCSKRYSNASW